MKKRLFQLFHKGIRGADTPFVIDDYNRSKPFASFLPGIAGREGIPLWVFYVNRAQAIVSAGVANKDGAFMEYHPANQAYAAVGQTGFRTFIRGTSGRILEPFAESTAQASLNRMFITPHDLSLESVDPSSGLTVTVNYFLLPDESFPGLCRRVTFHNGSRRACAMDVIDGLPQIIPYGAPGGLVKNMARTLEAFYDVINIDQGIPFYKLRTLPHDKPHVIPSPQGFFYWSTVTGAGSKKRGVVVHAEEVFGSNLGFTHPEKFAERSMEIGAQYLGNRTPCAFTWAKLALKPGASAEIRSIIGFAHDIEELNLHASRRMNVADFFDRAAGKNRDTIREVTDPFFTVSSDENFDQYCRQSYLDNVMRGGAPALFRSGERTRSVYIFSRKHGDLERDYNAFLVEPSYLSQGNGNFRDVHQNRRCDVWFEPGLGDENVRYFYTMIQLDGHNPLELLPERFKLDRPPHFLASVIRLVGAVRAKKVEALLNSEFRAGDLLRLLLPDSSAPDKSVPDSTGDAKSRGKYRHADRDAEPDEHIARMRSTREWDTRAWDIFSEIICHSEKRYRANFGEGYWVDHWKYGLDLIESFLGVYPDRKKELIFGPDDYSFFDSPADVLPRSLKYVLVDGIPRQLGAVTHDRLKSAMIARRIAESGSSGRGGRGGSGGNDGESDQQMVQTAAGSPLRVNLCAKILILLANKLASLDPSGTGVEMNADKPGWNDSMNGLPGMFGSSTPELFECRNLASFLRSALSEHDDDCGNLPLEAASFIEELSSLTSKKMSSMNYWDKSHDARERYLQKIRLGVYGRTSPISRSSAIAFLDAAIAKCDEGIARLVRGAKLPPTYMIHTPTAFTIQKDNAGRVIRNPVTHQQCIRISRFRSRPLPVFLEGVVHACRTLPDRVAGFHRAVRSSGLYDRKLGMYKLSESLRGEDENIGRGATFRPGWLENETVWLHMEYKYLLELLRAGRYAEFFSDWKKMGVPNLDPKIYGRSIYENSSFIASSVAGDPSMRGRGFVARLSGSTAEFIHIWIMMTTGKSPFRWINGKLELCLRPILPGEFFTKTPQDISWRGIETRLPTDSFACAFLGRTLLLYRNRSRKDTWKKLMPKHYQLTLIDGKRVEIAGPLLEDPIARLIRDGGVARIDVELEDDR